MIIAGTGHRPNKLGGHAPEIISRLEALALAVLQKHRPTSVISGMALGWDTALAEASIKLGIPLIAAVPFEGQEKKWPAQSQKRYCLILKLAQQVHIVTKGGYSPWAMQLRNEWMVDNADLVSALWDGSEGGTGNCIQYALKVKKLISNAWNSWIKYR